MRARLLYGVLVMFGWVQALGAEEYRLEARFPFGMPLPGSSIADPLPTLGTDTNPAAIGLTPGSQLHLLWGSALQGGGVTSGIADFLRLGLSVDRLSPPTGSDGMRTSFNVGFRFSEAFSLAMGWQHTFGRGYLDGRDPLSLGLLARPNRWLSCGLAGYNLTEESFGRGSTRLAGEDLAALGVGLAVRPGTDHVTLGVDLVVDRKARVWDPTAYLAVKVVDGIEVHATGNFRHEGSRWDWGIGGLLAVYSPFGDVLGGYRYVDGGDGDYFGALRFSSVSQATVLKPRHRYVMMGLPTSAAEEKPASLFGGDRPTLLETRIELAALADDAAVDGVILVMRNMSTGWAQAQELADSVSLLRRKGKKVVAFLISGGNQAFYVASRADHVVATPLTMLTAWGISGTLMFYRDFLKWLGIEAQFQWIGKHKSFPEQFINNEPSPAYREAHTAMLNDFFGQLVDGIATGRGVPVERAKEWIEAAPVTASQAKDLGMIDLIDDFTEPTETMEKLGYPGAVIRKNYPLRREGPSDWGDPERIAVLAIEGSIADGRSAKVPLLGQKFVGDDTIIQAMRSIGAAPGIAGVLVRINSRGGSGLASERMNRELKKLAKKKPVVVSIGDVAASGGYYIAVAGDRIFLSPGSVTGSIGIWFGKVVITELLDRLGIGRTKFERGKNASLMSTDRKLTAEELEGVRVRLQVYYDIFVQRVAEGRDKKAAEVEELAQGRVWSGRRALENGLADESGGSYEALQYLKSQAGIASSRPVTLVHYPRKSMSEAFAASLTGASASDNLTDTIEQIALQVLGTHLWAVDPWLLQ